MTGTGITQTVVVTEGTNIHRCPLCDKSPGGRCPEHSPEWEEWRKVIAAAAEPTEPVSTDPMVNGYILANHFGAQACPTHVQHAIRFFQDAPHARALVTTLPVGSNQGQGDVWQDIIDEMPNGLLRDVCIERRALGIEKHGKPLPYGDGRGLKDGLQEALDLAAYMRRDGLHEVSRAALALAGIVLERMAK